MKRLAIAMILGVLFPLAYTLIAGLLTIAFPTYFSDNMILFGQPTLGPIFAPSMFPMYLYAWIQSNHFFGLYKILDTVWFRTTLLVTPMVIYPAIFYGLLRLLGYPKAKSVKGIHEPPPPPASNDI